MPLLSDRRLFDFPLMPPPSAPRAILPERQVLPGHLHRRIYTVVTFSKDSSLLSLLLAGRRSMLLLWSKIQIHISGPSFGVISKKTTALTSAHSWSLSDYPIATVASSLMLKGLTARFEEGRWFFSGRFGGRINFTVLTPCIVHAGYTRQTMGSLLCCIFIAGNVLLGLIG